jgi:hypothetical protein
VNALSPNPIRMTTASWLCAAALLGGASMPAQAEPVDADAYYRLTTEFRGPQMALDVHNGGPNNNTPFLAPVADVSGQYWNFRLDDGYYRLTTIFRGANMCLDVINGGDRNNEVMLAACANHSGQYWKVKAQGGQVRLTSQFRGTGMCLDIFNGGPKNNHAHLAPCAAYSGQLWTMQPTGKTMNVAAGPADGQTYARIQNKWKPDQYLHIQQGPLEAGSIKDGWWSAQWHVQQVPGTPRGRRAETM